MPSDHYDYDAPPPTAVGKWQAAYQRARDLLELVELPPRGHKGSRQNQRRARMMAAAFHQLRVAAIGKCDIRRRRGHCSLCKYPVNFRPTRAAETTGEKSE